MIEATGKLILLKASLAAALVAMSAAAGTAVAGGGELTGSWSGAGVVTMPSGASEKARCRATFHGGGGSINMNAVCATASSRVAQTANLRQVGPSRFAGEFHNAEYNVTGSIRINVSGNSLNAALEGGGGSGHFHLSR